MCAVMGMFPNTTFCVSGEVISFSAVESPCSHNAGVIFPVGYS